MALTTFHILALVWEQFMLKNSYLSQMKYLMILAGLLLAVSAHTQSKTNSTEENEVYDVIVKLFDGMRAGDSSMVHSVFSDDVRMYTNFTDKKGEMHTTQGSLEKFLEAVGTPHDIVWDEKIWNTEVKVDMGVAQVWTDYAFYLGEDFSHCGIDAFHLVKDKEWKIVHLIDTRKKMNCEKPK